MAVAMLPAVSLSASPSPRRRRVSEIDLKNLSRTTAWRARKRGWACPQYHKTRVNDRDDFWFAENIAIIEVIISRTIRKLHAYGCFPHPWMSDEDIAQEIRIYLLMRAARLRAAVKSTKGMAYRMAMQAGLKALGLYGHKADGTERISLRKTGRMERHEIPQNTIG